MERFWSKVDKTDTCWLWTACTNAKGYGRISVAGKMVLAHRQAYELEVGHIPEGADILHRCESNSCVNPEHLYPRGPMTTRERFWSKVNKAQGCWLWAAGSDIHGYGIMKVDGKTTKAHRIAYELGVGDIPDGLFVCHHCDNPPCVNPSHLFVGTQLDNQRDASSKGRLSTPARRRASEAGALASRKFSDLTAAEIIEEYGKGGKTQAELGKAYGASQGTISDLVRRKTYTHL